jgi:hypothetical protein
MVGKLIDNTAVCHAPERVDLSVATASVMEGGPGDAPPHRDGLIGRQRGTIDPVRPTSEYRQYPISAQLSVSVPARTLARNGAGPAVLARAACWVMSAAGVACYDQGRLIEEFTRVQEGS